MPCMKFGEAPSTRRGLVVKRKRLRVGTPLPVRQKMNESKPIADLLYDFEDNKETYKESCEELLVRTNEKLKKEGYPMTTNARECQYFWWGRLRREK